jgi:hypothetical protein
LANISSYWIILDGIGVSTSKSVTSALPASRLPVFLDDGTTLTVLPASLITFISSNYLGTIYDASIGYYRVPCTVPVGSIHITFGTNSIKVQFCDISIEYDSTSCILGITAATNTDYVLGDSFLRAACVVLDLANQNIWLDQYTN